MQNFIKRILSSFFLLALLFFLLNTNSLLFILILSLIFLISCYEWFSLTHNIYLKIFGFLLLFLSFFSFYEIKSNNTDLLYFIFLITIGSDVGGYIFGKMFKGPKLTIISPNKTYAGSLGSFIISLVFIYLFFEILNLKIFAQESLNLKYIMLTIFLSLISQLGDLTISFFKRKVNIKNTGVIIPGHGGLLDRLDGMIFVLLFFYIIFYNDIN